MTTALVWSARSVCSRLQVGCVITTEDLTRTLSIGYNGPARKLPHNLCTGIAGACGCLHAEDNAVAMVDSTIPNKVAFVTHEPCTQCAQRLIQANVQQVYWLHRYRNPGGHQLLLDAQVRSSQMVLNSMHQGYMGPRAESLIRVVSTWLLTSRLTGEGPSTEGDHSAGRT